MGLRSLVDDDVSVAWQHVEDYPDRHVVVSDASHDVVGDRGARPQLQPAHLVGLRHACVELVQRSHLLVALLGQDLVRAPFDVAGLHDLGVLHEGEREVAVVDVVRLDVATHTGRRTVVTTLYVEGAEALDDIARFVGHAKTSTTAGYVKRLGQRPRTVADRARGVLDRQSEAAASGVRNHPAGSGSDRGSDDPSQSDTAANNPDPSPRSEASRQDGPELS
jgi:hypothetical protein